MKEDLWVNWYSDYKNHWKEIIETVAAEEHRTTQVVEKICRRVIKSEN